MGKTVNIKDLREKGDIVLVVFKEHTLGYINLERPGTLAVYVLAYGKGQTGAVHLQFRYRPQNIR